MNDRRGAYGGDGRLLFDPDIAVKLAAGQQDHNQTRASGGGKTREGYGGKRDCRRAGMSPKRCMSIARITCWKN